MAEVATLHTLWKNTLDDLITLAQACGQKF